MSASVQNVVKKVFGNAIKKAFPKLGQVEAMIVPANPSFGDYQCNNAMSLFSEYKAEPAVIGADVKNPKAVADKISASLDTDMFEKVTVAPAGFISVKLSLKFINEQVRLVFMSYIVKYLLVVTHFC